VLWVIFILFLTASSAASEPSPVGQSATADPCKDGRSVRRIIFDANLTADQLKTALKDYDVLQICNGRQDIEWIAEGAEEVRILIAPNSYQLPQGKCPACEGRGRANLPANAIDYDDIVVYDKAADDSRPAKRASLKAKKHMNGGWIYYQISIIRKDGTGIVHDPFVIIQP